MSDVVSKDNIREYVKRNTSAKFPMEQKYVYSFIDALFNSCDVIEQYDILKDRMMNGETFSLFHSISSMTSVVNTSTLRNIIAYSLIKKDINLFKMISQELFIGTVEQRSGLQFSTFPYTYTDESNSGYKLSVEYTHIITSWFKSDFRFLIKLTNEPNKIELSYNGVDKSFDEIVPEEIYQIDGSSVKFQYFENNSNYELMFTSTIPVTINDIKIYTESYSDETTDMSGYTDMKQGIISIQFNNYYCIGNNSNYQNIHDLVKSSAIFEKLITICKPARIPILVSNIGFSCITRDNTGTEIDENLSSRFISPLSKEYPNEMTGWEMITQLPLYDVIAAFDNCHASDSSYLSFTKIIDVQEHDTVIKLIFTRKHNTFTKASKITGNADDTYDVVDTDTEPLIIINTGLTYNGSTIDKFKLLPEIIYKNDMSNTYTYELDIHLGRNS